jgi:prevent-host-death family protein
MKHMSEVGIRALKQNASAVVAAAAAGETITITDRGRPVAQLSPIPASPLERLRAAGRVRAPTRDIRDLPAPGPAPEDGPSLSEGLRAMRESERY